MAGAPLVVVSNRGPLSFRSGPDGDPAPGGTGGGLAGALRSLLPGMDCTWVSCAMSDADRAAAARGLMTVDGIELRMVEPSPDVYRMAYDVVSNATLWFVHHHLFDTARRPRFDNRWNDAWDAYVAFNDQFCDAVTDVAAEGATVLVHDYHLSLLPAALRAKRPDLKTAHFSHTPFADPGVLRILPATVAEAVLRGMTAAGSCGFHARRWEQSFRACCADQGLDPPRSFVSPLPADIDALRARVGASEVAAARARLDDLAGERKLVVRVDRLEPTKNLLRGFWAFDELLARRPDLREKVVMLAVAYASRQSLPEYLAYANEVAHVVDQINERWSRTGWTPIVLEVSDDHPRSLAALTRYDVLLVNPVRDGLNLVAKEGPVVNDRQGVLVLSREAGAAAELEGPALEVNPFDVSATASALGVALDMPAAQRSTRAHQLADIIGRRTPRQWLDELVDRAG